MFNNCSYPRAVVAELTGVLDQVATGISVKSLRIGSMLSESDKGLIVLIVTLAAAAGAKTFAGVGVIVVVTVMTVLELVSRGLDSRIEVLATAVAGGIASGSGIDALAGVPENMWGATMFALERISIPLKTWLCGAEARCCSPTAVLTSRALQARMPSDQVWSMFLLPGPPHCPNHEPPRPQQLLLPDL